MARPFRLRGQHPYSHSQITIWMCKINTSLQVSLDPSLALWVRPKTVMVLCRLGSASQKTSQEPLESLPWASVNGKEKSFPWSVKIGQFSLSQSCSGSFSSLKIPEIGRFNIIFCNVLIDFHWDRWDGDQAHFPHPSLVSFSPGTWTNLRILLLLLLPWLVPRQHPWKTLLQIFWE